MRSWRPEQEEDVPGTPRGQRERTTHYIVSDPAENRDHRPSFSLENQLKRWKRGNCIRPGNCRVDGLAGLRIGYCACLAA